MEPALTTRQLTIGYKGRQPLAGPATLKLAPASMTLLLGGNGCGKSTLLRTLSGALEPLGGEIMLGEQPLASLGAKRVARMVSLVTTERTLAGGLTVEQTVALGRQPHTDFFGRLTTDDRSAVERAMERMGIADMRHRYTATLSDGERQKTMIARALAQDTPIILLDEPTTFLDIAARLEVMALLNRLATDDGKTILLSTHDVTEALAVAPQAWLMSGGKILAETVNKLVADGCFNSLFPGISFNPSTLTFSL